MQLRNTEDTSTISDTNLSEESKEVDFFFFVSFEVTSSASLKCNFYSEEILSV
jgi:hypothetical protein